MSSILSASHRPFTAPNSSSRSTRNASSSARSQSTQSIATIFQSRTELLASASKLADKEQVICALTESRGISSTVGLAFVSLGTAEAVLCQISDNQTYVKTLQKLYLYEPSHILFPQSTNAIEKSKLLQILNGSVEIDAIVHAIPRKYWDEAEGARCLDSLAFKDDIPAIKISVGGNFYASCSFAAAMSYIQQTMRISFVHNTMRVKYEPPEGSMMIDVSTVRSLELIENIQSSKSAESLFGLLNITITKMGQRLLRNNILQPPLEKGVIENRYEAVQELLLKEKILDAVRKALSLFQDIEKVLTELVLVDTHPSIKTLQQSVNRVIYVKAYLCAVPSIFDALEGVSSDILTRIRQLCNPTALEDIRRSIDLVINNDVKLAKTPMELRNQRTYAAGAIGLLDVARWAYKEAQQDAGDILKEMQNGHGFHLEMKYNEARQFYLRVSIGDLEGQALPKAFINQQKVRNAIECQTLELVKQNRKIAESHNEVMLMSESIVLNLLDEIRTNIAPLFRISDSVAILDMLAAFTQLAKSNNYSRPELTSTLAVKNGRHPVIERIRTGKYVANDVYATGTKRMQVVTGCNMSGKSTYIRAVALITIMAQIGCFVPADYASIPLRHQLFARVSIDDSAASNLSTFACEMRETAFILRHVDSRSLVIVDELGRGTSTRDGLVIAIAVAEALAQSRSLVWFVTHFRGLPMTLAEREGVVNLHLESSLSVGVNNGKNHMKMLYRIADGPETQERYGLALARGSGLPSDVLEVAERVANSIIQAKEKRVHDTVAVFRARRRKLLLGLHEQLAQAKDGGLAGETLRQWLKRLQDEFVVRMSSLDEEQAAALQLGVRNNDSDSMSVTDLSMRTVSSNISSFSPSRQHMPITLDPPQNSSKALGAQTPISIDAPFQVSLIDSDVISADEVQTLSSSCLEDRASVFGSDIPVARESIESPMPQLGDNYRERVSETPVSATNGVSVRALPDSSLIRARSSTSNLLFSSANLPDGSHKTLQDNASDEELWDQELSRDPPLLGEATQAEIEKRFCKQPATELERNYCPVHANADTGSGGGSKEHHLGRGNQVAQMTSGELTTNTVRMKDLSQAQNARRDTYAIEGLHAKELYLMSGALP